MTVTTQSHPHLSVTKSRMRLHIIGDVFKYLDVAWICGHVHVTVNFSVSRPIIDLNVQHDTLNF